MNTTLITAFLATQFFILAIIYLGILILNLGESDLHSLSSVKKVSSLSVTPLFVGFALMSLACLSFTEDFVSMSSPIFRNIHLPSLTKANSFLTVFLMDLFFVGVIIKKTGGSKDSPFTSLLLGLPAISIFLKEPPQRFLTYTLIAAFIFWAFFRWNRESTRYVFSISTYNFSYLVVTIATLVLSTVVGYSTLPI